MSAATPALRVLAAIHSGAVLVARPRGVVHVHPGGLTRSGRSVPATGRPFCGVNSRRLRVLATSGAEIPAALTGRRFCRSCTTRLPARLGSVVELVTREDREVAFGDLTVADLHLAGVWCRTPDETYQVQSLLMLVHGPKPIRPTSASSRELLAAYDAVKARRDQLVEQARTDDEIAATRATQEAVAHNRALVEKNRRREVAIEKAAEVALAGGYVLPHQRDLLNSA
ncbi:MAG TPA: hypothetical protein VLI04_02010 [Nocardioidaceae bacterium]|nr:hypothetical protein [Nocardioidaceae bacterium]